MTNAQDPKAQAQSQEKATTKAKAKSTSGFAHSLAPNVAQNSAPNVALNLVSNSAPNSALNAASNVAPNTASNSAQQPAASPFADDNLVFGMIQSISNEATENESTVAVDEQERSHDNQNFDFDVLARVRKAKENLRTDIPEWRPASKAKAQDLEQSQLPSEGQAKINATTSSVNLTANLAANLASSSSASSQAMLDNTASVVSPLSSGAPVSADESFSLDDFMMDENIDLSIPDDLVPPADMIPDADFLPDGMEDSDLAHNLGAIAGFGATMGALDKTPAQQYPQGYHAHLARQKAAEKSGKNTNVPHRTYRNRFDVNDESEKVTASAISSQGGLGQGVSNGDALTKKQGKSTATPNSSNPYGSTSSQEQLEEGDMAFWSPEDHIKPPSYLEVKLGVRLRLNEAQVAKLRHHLENLPESEKVESLSYFFDSLKPKEDPEDPIYKYARETECCQPINLAYIQFLAKHFPMPSMKEQSAFNVLLMCLFQRMQEGHICINLASVINLFYVVRDLLSTIGEHEPVLASSLINDDVEDQDKEPLEPIDLLARALMSKMAKTNQELKHLLDSSKAITSDPETELPLIWDLNRLYIRRCYLQEQNVVKYIKHVQSSNFDVEHSEQIHAMIEVLFPAEAEKALPDHTNWQKIAALMSTLSDFTVISGGPGTGKTTTVFKVLLLLLCLGEKNRNIMMCAPTAKAAARMGESIIDQLKRESVQEMISKLCQISGNDPEMIKSLLPMQAQTVHKLLKVRPHLATPVFNENNKLECDVLIVDEVSMLELSLFSKLTSALPDGCKLILLGDKDQLSSVGAGMVLGDICSILDSDDPNRISPKSLDFICKMTGYSPEQVLRGKIADHIVLLNYSWRSKDVPEIGQLASLFNDSKTSNLLPDPDKVDEILSGLHSRNTLIDIIINGHPDTQGYIQNPLNDSYYDERYAQIRRLCAIGNDPISGEFIAADKLFKSGRLVISAVEVPTLQMETELSLRQILFPEQATSSQPNAASNTQQGATNVEPQTLSQAETKAQIQADTKLDTQAETKIETQVDTKLETQSETKVQTQSEINAQAETKVQTQAETQAEPKALAPVVLYNIPREFNYEVFYNDQSFKHIVAHQMAVSFHLISPEQDLSKDLFYKMRAHPNFSVAISRNLEKLKVNSKQKLVQMRQNLVKAWVDPNVEDNFAPFLKRLKELNFTVKPESPECEELFKLMDRFRVLCSNHSDWFGDRNLNTMIEKEVLQQYVNTADKTFDDEAFFPGKIVLITENDPLLNLVNGSVGFCAYVDYDESEQSKGFAEYVQLKAQSKGLGASFNFNTNPYQAHKEAESKQLRVFIPVGVKELDGESHTQVNVISPLLLSHYESGYAMSIHKSQGSEYEHVAIALSQRVNPILTKELVYTGITRAKKRVELVASVDAIKYALSHAVTRESGLALRLFEPVESATSQIKATQS